MAKNSVCLRIGIAACALLTACAYCQADDLLKVDHRALVSRADLDYDKPASRSEEGQPIGNGRMGSLVWTTPSALHFQINRVDVFGQDSYTTSFPKQDSDYASGCGYVDINVVDTGEDVFAGKEFNQHLSLYDALMTAKGNDVTARVIAWPARDVIAVEIDDQRDRPAAINIDLRMLRYAIQGITGRNYELAANHSVEYHTAEHTAASDLDIRDGRILLTQKFTEHAFYDASAIAIAAFGRGRECRARYLNDSTVQLSVSPGKSGLLILIASAATFDRDQDVGKLALAQLDAATAMNFAGLAEDTAKWWHDFWSKGFVYMQSPDGQADFVEANYTYFLYIMGASSRGNYPPRFGGMLWYTNGDMRRWGSQYWWANTSAYYSNLMPANRLELMDPMYSMYTGMMDACALAARQQWGSRGIWIPEITFFNGPEKLPDDIAAELQDLMLVKKPYEEHSAKFQWWAETKNRHNARWNFEGDGHWEHGHYVVPTKGAGIFGHCTHILSDASKIGNLFYRRYLFTGDEDWLRDRAYPIVKGAAEFYRNFPNLKKEDDGKYHLHHLNNGESSWDTSDTPNEITGMRTALSLATRISTILGVDADLRPQWQEVYDNLAAARTPGRGRRPPNPTGGDAGAPGGAAAAAPDTAQRNPLNQGGGRRDGNRPFGAFVYGGPGAIPPNPPDEQQKSRFLGFNALGSFIDTEGIGGAQIFRNRLRLREGPGAVDCEHLGGLMSGIHSTLLDSTPDDNGAPLIQVFTSVWPRSWDCAFKLLARGGFLVASSLREREVQFVEIESQLGGTCRMKNPWPKAEVAIHRGNSKRVSLSGEMLTFETKKGDSIVLLPAAKDLKAVARAIP
jgi:Domain of unknown function (DUF5703)